MVSPHVYMYPKVVEVAKPPVDPDEARRLGDMAVAGANALTPEFDLSAAAMLRRFFGDPAADSAVRQDDREMAAA